MRDAVLADSSVRVFLTSGEERNIAYAGVQELYARMLPATGPFASTVFFDIIPGPDANGRVAPLRFVPTTRANYAVLPGGAAVVSQENFRRLALRIRTLQPAVLLDADTKAFIEEHRAPRQLASAHQFTDYDARYPG